MDWKPVLALIDKALATKNRSDDEVSRKAGHPDAIRNMRRKASSGGKGSANFETMMDVARELEIAPEAICRAAMGFPAENDERQAIRMEVLRELAGDIGQRIAPAENRKPRRTAAR